MADYTMCLVLGGLIPCFRDMRSSPLTGISHAVAKYSYGTYLFHVPVMWFSFFYAASFLNTPLQWVLFGVLSAAVPWAAYRWIENPMIVFGRSLADRASKPEGDLAMRSAATAGAAEQIGYSGPMA